MKSQQTQKYLSSRYVFLYPLRNTLNFPIITPLTRSLILFQYYLLILRPPLSLITCPLEGEVIVRVVHCGDAPGDVLAAKYCSEENKFGDSVTVSCIAVATGKFSADYLSSLFGDFEAGKWEPYILENGIADPSFIDLCCIETAND